MHVMILGGTLPGAITGKVLAWILEA